MIAITLENLMNSVDALKSLSQKQLKARSAYQISKILKAADEEISNFNETRMQLIKKYGEKDETGELKTDENGNVHIVTEKLQSFNDELQELLKTFAELNVNQIPVDELGDISFTPMEITQLEYFIDFE